MAIPTCRRCVRQHYNFQVCPPEKPVVRQPDRSHFSVPEGYHRLGTVEQLEKERFFRRRDDASETI